MAGCPPPGPVLSPQQALAEVRTLVRRGELKEALALAESAQKRARTGAPEERWRLRLARAEALLSLGQSRDTLHLLEGAPPADSSLATLRLLHQGWARYRLGEYESARALLDQALVTARQAGSPALESEVEGRRGPALSRLARAGESVQALRRANQLARQAGDPYLQAAALGNLGFHYMQVTREDEAVPLFEQALELAKKAGARRYVMIIQGNLGRCYHGLGDPERAIELLTLAVRESEALADKINLQNWYGVLGDVYLEHNRDLGRAIAQYRKALDLAREVDDAYNQGLQLRNLAETFLDAGQVDHAETYGRQAAELCAKHPVPEIELWNRLSQARIASARGRAREAETGYRQVIAEAAAKGYSQIGWFGNSGLAALYQRENQPAQAEAAYQAALRSVESARARMTRDGWKLTFQQGAIRFYRDYVAFLMRRGQAERALEVAEVSRARLLAESLNLDTAALELVPAARLVQTAHSAGAALVSYWMASPKSYLWVVTEAGVQAAELPSAQTLQPHLTAYLTAVQQGRDPLNPELPAGRELSRILLAPLVRLAPRTARFIVVPDGPLHQLNLESLPAPEGATRYWIEDVTVSVAPSLALLEPGRTSQLRPDSMLAIGNPVFSKDFAPLPSAEMELQTLRRRFRPTVYEGPEAHPDAYRESDPGRFSLIHFATHATANPRSPLDSAVILSNRNDRFKLYARDVIAVPIRARLVTISACRGAGARVYGGEGLVGFSWAFLRAGAENVVAGLWDVADASTARLVDSMYASLARGGSPAQALRSAKLSMVRSRSAWAKPFYWAPFQVYTRTGGQ